MPSNQLTPKQAAELVGVSESTVRRWCDANLLAFAKTTGGHRRIDRVTLLDFARQRGLHVVDTSPISTAGRGGRLSSDPELAECLYEQLVSGQEDSVRQFVVGLIERRGDVVNLCDQIVAPAMHKIGSQWFDNELPIFREHIATQLMQMALWAARSHIERPPADAPAAICATLSNDPYTLGSVMSALVLQQVGFRAVVLGPDTPVDEIVAAASESNAALVAVSVGALPSMETRVDEFGVLSQAARANKFRVLAGGNRMTAELRRLIQADFFGDTMAHLATYCQRIIDDMPSPRAATAI